MRTRPIAVEVHPNRRLIEQELAEGVPIRISYERYGIHRTFLERYKKTRIPELVLEMAKKIDITNADELFSRILKLDQWMKKLSDSYDEYLQDPDIADMYHIGLQAQEITVVYTEKITLPLFEQLPNLNRQILWEEGEEGEPKDGNLVVLPYGEIYLLQEKTYE